MKTLVRSLAVVAAFAVTATPALAQNLNTNADAAVRARLTVGFTPDPHTAQVTAGGNIDASRADDSCAGQISRRASFTLRYTAGELPLIISATSDADTTLAVRAPNGAWSCNDDTNGLNPQVRFDTPTNGRYQIWVGRFGQSGETAPATLSISEIPTAGETTGEQPDFSLDPSYGVIDLTAGFTPDPHTIAIAAGGELDAASLGVPGCVGSIARAPDYRVNWTAGSGSLPLIFSVGSQADTTLVINDAGGNWLCSDDDGNEGLNPAVTIQSPASGQYDVWVGTYGGGELQDSTLHVSELYSQ